MSNEHLSQPAQRKPYEDFGLTEQEHLFWRVRDGRFKEILNDDQTIIHAAYESLNNYGDFLFVTVSRPGDQQRICITFYGLGYHEQRERWITDEWFWYQAEPFSDVLNKNISKKEAQELLKQRMDEIATSQGQDTQSERGKLFEILADITDEDGALAEMEDLESLDNWLFEVDQQTPPEEPPPTSEDDPLAGVEDFESLGSWLSESELDRCIPPEEPPPTGKNLLDQASREKLSPLYSGEEKGLEALAQVKFFKPDSNWTWYASEFDGEDLFFGLVSGFEVELGYFSLKELQEVKGPLGLQVERDIYFEPQTLGKLIEIHRQEKED